MSEWICADKLKKSFRCYGHFYRLQVDGHDPLPCRSVLEITSLPREAVDAGATAPDLFKAGHSALALPDAVVIMMNPGSSRPIEPGDTDRLLRMPMADPSAKPLVLTRPDNTQYQIMRVMRARRWAHVRVLNLSDLRESKSPLFIALTQRLDRRVGGKAHSLFCEKRADERALMLRRKPGAPLILGWGQSAGLLPLAEACRAVLGEAFIVSVPCGNHPALTAHPSPMLQTAKEEWVRLILQQLDGGSIRFGPTFPA